MKTVTLDVRSRAEALADVARVWAARLVDRDVKAVHGDITALIKAGILNREDKGIVFPFEAVKVEFLLRAA
jgi:predicted transcriptional regulator